MRELAYEDFEGQSIRTKATIGVFFYAKWCPFCRACKPDFEALKPNRFELALADLSEKNNPLWEDFDIKTVPMIIVFKDGKAVWRKDGKPFLGLGKKDLKAMMDFLSKEKSSG
jgi:thioredoxin-like negative regulator of GroEL